MPTLLETFTWVAYGAELKARLGITGTDEDTQLQRQLTNANRVGDAMIGCKWPNATDVIPDDVFEGHIEYIQSLRATDGTTDGLQSVKTGDLSETYRDPIKRREAARKAAAVYWLPFALKPWRVSL